MLVEGFTVTFSDGTTYTLSPVPSNLPNTANGVGFSDFIIALDNGNAIPIPVGATSVTFSLELSGLNDGPDRFFVVPGASSVPDGGLTLVLLGGALVGFETLRRKFRV